MHSDINLFFFPWYRAVLLFFQTEVVTLAEQACEDIAGPFASMVGVLNINNNNKIKLITITRPCLTIQCAKKGVMLYTAGQTTNVEGEIRRNSLFQTHNLKV